MARPPKNVKKFVREGEICSFNAESNEWVYCRLTSKRVREKGKSKTVQVRVITGRYTIWGRRDHDDDFNVKPTITQFTCEEYGISKVLKTYLPQEWVLKQGEYAEALFLKAIQDKLPTSYLLHDKTISIPEGIYAGARIERLLEMYAEKNITLERLTILGSIVLLRYPDHNEISAPTAEQSALLEELGVSLL